MNAELITIAVMTVDRQPCYLHQTLASMFMAERRLHDLPVVRLVAGTNTLGYLDNYAHHERIAVHPLGDFEQQVISSWSLPRRHCHNYWRCLSLPVADGGGICICEDDVIFRDNFVSHLVKTVDQVQEAGIRDYGLALSTCYDFEAEGRCGTGRSYCAYDDPFYGTQAMYYPAQTAAELREYLYECGVQRYTKPSDILVRDRYADRIYACTPSLVDHIGVTSTGLGCTGRSPSFYRPMR
ncbi:MAG: hypothetical protein B7Z73_10135 [Planctomycetia bacterium 21-64-5]|nr:MAG: hypothetical protein B7Z73_10135 [Planctomycetia bacterium 21-64-5]HQU45287.1 hypothetical protein [Pirellulales bacterium]